MPRRKSGFERFFSFNQHRKRWRAARHASPAEDLEALKARLIEGDDVQQTRGAEKSLELHLSNLRREFSGEPEIVYYHAKLIVLIRREFRVEEKYVQFKDLWQRQGEFLCSKLNIRWLVSACDTFADHDPDPALRNAALLGSVLVNTVKVYESERLITNSTDNPVDEDKVEHLQTKLVPLFEGLSCFTVGTDDTLRNMRWRLEPLFAEGPVGKILKTVYDRLQVNDTAFARLRELHRRDKTGWW
ncbi:hypothetical protein MRS76_03035 [Rhizobiaceae bacterium n13]|uniref:Uncharacterized protein n=1 Tax=Ferirhizobium litorale TaxID=2927786 RepID=A0AAE3QBR3_9HYPH|nr:hypothetical protein [Fererhizobium litorale]MDI7860920.1 hypothetical protein [Fererhizobium litorale]MDI7921068.1 hypothetical protein [Fererhizobium litorale]